MPSTVQPTSLRRGGSDVTGAEIIKKYLKLAGIATALGLLVSIYIDYSELGYLPPLRDKIGTYLLSVLCTIVICLTVYQIDLLLDRLIPWRKNFVFRFFTGFLINEAVVVGLLGVVTAYILVSSVEVAFKVITLFSIALFIYEIFYGWFYSYRYYAITQVEDIRSERWQLELQFESLKNQISPHYLFNCLNTISSLLYKDSQMAEEFIRRMADTFRYVLTNQRQQLVTVREEVEFVKAYYYLLQVRYEHHLRLEVNLPKSILDTLIPPLSMQILVENAVKHNQISKDQPLLVYIAAQDNTFINVVSTKTTSMKPAASFKIGLDNIRHRYEFFSSEKVVIKDDEKFTVQLPVIRPDKKKSGLKKMIDA